MEFKCGACRDGLSHHDSVSTYGGMGQLHLIKLQVIFVPIPFSPSIYLFLATLGLGCLEQAFSSCGKQALLFVVLLQLLIVVASPVLEHRL